MGFLPLRAKPGKKGKTRPIIRDRWAEDELASAQLKSNNGGRALLKGPDYSSQRLMGGSSGSQIPGSGLGGGAFSPTSNKGTVAGGGAVHS